MTDPRNPKQTDAPEHDSWAKCVNCGREASHVRDIRHRKGCIWRRTGPDPNVVARVRAVCDDPAWRCGAAGARPWHNGRARDAREIVRLIDAGGVEAAMDLFRDRILPMWAWRDTTPYEWTRTWLTDEVRALRLLVCPTALATRSGC